MTGVVGAGAVLIRDDKVLLVQENKDYNRGLWNLPLGKLEANENIFKATVREVKEETNFDIKIEGLIGVYQSINQKGVDVVRFVFKGTILKGLLKAQRGELLDARWFSLDEIKRMNPNQFSWPGVRDAILDFVGRGTIDTAFVKSYIP